MTHALSASKTVSWQSYYMKPSQAMSAGRVASEGWVGSCPCPCVKIPVFSSFENLYNWKANSNGNYYSIL